MADVTFPAGHFHSHNAEVLGKIKAGTTIKDSVKTYVQNILTDAEALVQAGASAKQRKDSAQALLDQFDTKAWPAILTNTKGAE